MTKKILLLDVETINTRDRSIFDFSYLIAEFDTFEVVETGAYVVEEGWKDIDKAYYSKNKSRYETFLEVGTYEKASMMEIRTLFNQLVKREDIVYITAFNINFDIGALSYSFKKYAGSKDSITYQKIERFAKILDVGVLASTVAMLNPDYKRFCLENNKLTKTGKLSTTAESFYGFTIDNPEHIEAHMGSSDCYEELDILAYFYNKIKGKQDFERLFKNILTVSYNKTPFWIIMKRY